MDKNQQTKLELQAKLYEVIKGQYASLDALVKRMQDDKNGVAPFKQVESERLALSFALDYFDDIEEQIKQLQIRQTQTAEEEHRQEVDETTDMITTEDVIEQAVYMANAPDCCADEHAENMLGMLGANIVEPEIYHDEDECPNKVKELADYAVSEGTQHSEDGTWETSYTELYYHFGVEIEAGDELCEKLAKALRERPEVESVDITEDGLDVTYNPDYCESLQEQGITQTM